MEFIISGIHFPISEEMKNYRYYRKLFSDLADQVASEFDALYTKQNHRLEDIIQNGSNQYAQCMYPVIQTALKCLAEKDILSYDAAGFWSKYGKYFNHWSEAYDHLEEQYAAIVLDEKSMDEYRTLRRKTRGRVVGGGFGVGGALKGMAAAGAMNAAAGAGKWDWQNRFQLSQQLETVCNIQRSRYEKKFGRGCSNECVQLS